MTLLDAAALIELAANESPEERRWQVWAAISSAYTALRWGSAGAKVENSVAAKITAEGEHPSSTTMIDEHIDHITAQLGGAGSDRDMRVNVMRAVFWP